MCTVYLYVFKIVLYVAKFSNMPIRKWGHFVFLRRGECNEFGSDTYRAVYLSKYKLSGVPFKVGLSVF